MITIIFAPPRYGKTALMTHLANMELFNRQRHLQMVNEIKQKNANGFNYTMPVTHVCANYDIIGKKFGYSRRPCYRINPFRLGYANKNVKTHLTVPYGVYCITEAQKYFNSRLSRFYPSWQSNWFEQHGHDYLDIYMDVQRPGLIDVNIRDLATFIEIRSLKIQNNECGKPNKLIWKVRKIEDAQALDKYLASGKQDKTCYTEETITADYNVFAVYNSRMCKPKFYDKFLEEDSDFDMKTAEEVEETKQGYIKFLKEFDDELPQDVYNGRKENFYMQGAGG